MRDENHAKSHSYIVEHSDNDKSTATGQQGMLMKMWEKTDDKSGPVMMSCQPLRDNDTPANPVALLRGSCDKIDTHKRTHLDGE